MAARSSMWEGESKLEAGAPVAFFGTHRSLPELTSFRSLCNGIKASVIESAVQALKVSWGKSPRFAVLDVGCGRGGDLAKWSRYRPRLYFGVDAAAATVKEALHRHQMLVGRGGLAASFAAIDVRSEKIPLEDQSVDVASLQFSLQYVFDTEAGTANLLSEMQRLVRPGGIIVAIFPDGDRVASLLSSSQALVAFGHFSFRKFERTGQALATHDPPIGIPYSFTLGSKRDSCPEYMVSTQYLHRLLAQSGFEPLVAEEPFSQNAQHFYTNSSQQIKTVVTAVMRGSPCTEQDWCTLGAFRVLIARRSKPS
jgi:mRNA (guanine-N7-)-methyltransferase